MIDIRARSRCLPLFVVLPTVPFHKRPTEAHAETATHLTVSLEEPIVYIVRHSRTVPNNVALYRPKTNTSQKIWDAGQCSTIDTMLATVNRNSYSKLGLIGREEDVASLIGGHMDICVAYTTQER